MAAKRDLYEVLGISKTADEKTIKIGRASCRERV